MLLIGIKRICIQLRYRVWLNMGKATGIRRLVIKQKLCKGLFGRNQREAKNFQLLYRFKLGKLSSENNN